MALAGPAAASDAQGWYLDIGAGWDHMGNLEVPQSPLLDANGNKIDKINTGSSALVEGSIGYRFPDRIRAEMEVGYSNHNVDATGPTTSEEGARTAERRWRARRRPRSGSRARRFASPLDRRGHDQS